ncbi:hypothetical protein C9J01_27780 [Photobacterium rosenbergii]|uniref:Uncharacterized protein n=1 Tax=Photobacterium rosenbergii TaxID=294936 RepID=A0A2T3MYS1_9GAMM|nr:hypothetical protein C9J01_27780 [Photobacterium rosenbergii]
MVLGPWSLVLGPWSLVLGPWSLVLGPWSCRQHSFIAMIRQTLALAFAFARTRARFSQERGSYMDSLGKSTKKQN